MIQKWEEAVCKARLGIMNLYHTKIEPMASVDSVIKVSANVSHLSSMEKMYKERLYKLL